MSIRATLTVLRAAGMAGVPMLLWGPPGEGKSSLIETLGRIDRVQVGGCAFGHDGLISFG